MKNSDFGRRIISMCAGLAIVAGCALRQGQSPIPSAENPAAPVPGAASGPEGSWVAPEAAGQDLLYVSDVGTGKVNMYTYPRGKLVGTLTGFQRPQAMCVDKEGNVFIPDLSAFKIYKYRHGAKKPMAVLHDPGEDPDDCAVDPTTGNLAVANLSTPYTGQGNILLYAGARGKPKRLRDQHIIFYLFCGYDDNGNLYLDGMNAGAFEFAEIPQGTTNFVDVSLDKTFRYGGAVQWDGKDVAVGDYESDAIYRFAIDGQKGTEVGKTHLRGSNFAIGFWIQGSKVIGPNDDSTNVMFWDYPHGGPSTKSISGLHSPWGAVVSLAK
jgi:hypothetical protein